MIRPHKDDPTAVRRTALRARFDRIFSRITGFTDLDAAVARLHANKDELLLVLDRPDIPLHTNGSENAVRSFVTKHRISGFQAQTLEIFGSFADQWVSLT